jgi:hypothetical protein
MRPRLRPVLGCVTQAACYSAPRTTGGRVPDTAKELLLRRSRRCGERGLLYIGLQNNGRDPFG